MKYYSVDFDQEICCDFCNEVVHIHFDWKTPCPVCDTEHAATDIYGFNPWEIFETEDGLFSCEECGSKFKITQLYPKSSDFDAIIEILQEKELKQ